MFSSEDAVGRAALPGAARVAAADRAVGGDLVAVGVVVELLAGQVLQVRGAARRVGQVEADHDRGALVGVDRHRLGARGRQVLGGRRADLLEVGVGRRALRRPRARVLRPRCRSACSLSKAPPIQATPPTISRAPRPAPNPARMRRRRRSWVARRAICRSSFARASLRCRSLLEATERFPSSRPGRNRAARHTPARVYGHLLEKRLRGRAVRTWRPSGTPRGTISGPGGDGINGSWIVAGSVDIVERECPRRSGVRSAPRSRVGCSSVRKVPGEAATSTGRPDRRQRGGDGKCS